MYTYRSARLRKIWKRGTVSVRVLAAYYEWDTGTRLRRVWRAERPGVW